MEIERKWENVESEPLFIFSSSLHSLFLFSFSLHFLKARLAGWHNLCSPGWAIEASKLRIAFGALLAWVKTRLPSWYETQIADEDNCGLSVSPTSPPLPCQHRRGHGSRCGVTFHRGAAAEAKTQTQDAPAQNMHPCPVATHFVGSSFGSFRILKWERLTKEEVVLSVGLLIYVVISCHRIQDCFLQAFIEQLIKWGFTF